MIVGLTGGICCGKSTATATFREHNIPVVDADVIARKVVEPNSIGLEKITNAFGPNFIKTDGNIDRDLLGALVFKDKYAMSMLNNIMLPMIEYEASRQIRALETEHQIVIYDGATIIENGHAYKYRPLILVSCPIEIQLDRLMKRNNLSKDQAMDRIKSQLPNEEKVKWAEYVISTVGSIEESVKQTEDIIKILRSKV